MNRIRAKLPAYKNSFFPHHWTIKTPADGEPSAAPFLVGVILLLCGGRRGGSALRGLMNLGNHALFFGGGQRTVLFDGVNQGVFRNGSSLFLAGFSATATAAAFGGQRSILRIQLLLLVRREQRADLPPGGVFDGQEHLLFLSGCKRGEAQNRLADGFFIVE